MRILQSSVFSCVLYLCCFREILNRSNSLYNGNLFRFPFNRLNCDFCTHTLTVPKGTVYDSLFFSCGLSCCGLSLFIPIRWPLRTLAELWLQFVVTHNLWIYSCERCTNSVALRKSWEPIWGELPANLFWINLEHISNWNFAFENKRCYKKHPYFLEFWQKFGQKSHALLSFLTLFYSV